RMRNGAQIFLQLFEETRLADSCLTGDEDQLSFPLLDQLPARLQRPALVLASDEGRQPPRRRRGEAIAHAAWPHDAVHADRLGDALQRLRATVFDVEQSGDQP